MKEIVNKTDKFIVCRYGNVYRIHFYDDKRKKVDEMKSFITKSFDKVKRFL